MDLIAAFDGARLPNFIFTNKLVFDNFLSYQIQINDEVSKAIQSEGSPPKLRSSDVFEVSEEVQESLFESIPRDFSRLIDSLKTYQINKKDIITLKLYLTFMELKFSEKHDHLFMRQTQRFLQSSQADIADKLDPNLNFRFTKDVID